MFWPIQMLFCVKLRNTLTVLFPLFGLHSKNSISLIKKTTTYKEQNPEKVRHYLELLAGFQGLPIVYIDETGIDTYLYRKKGRAPRGEKIYDKISGRRFERVSVVAGQVGTEIISPMLYKQSMTSDFFMTWFESQLLQSLDTPHLIVMDNASFHPKSRIDELCIENKHYFLPLPPYSPELNPIEQFWANLKNKVTELLKRFTSVEDSLVYCF